jgi:serine protease AprX
MHPRAPRTMAGTFVYLLLFGICLVGFLQGATTTSLSSKAEVRGQSSEVRDQRNTEGRNLTSNSRSLFDSPDLNELFLQTPAGKIAAPVIDDTADGKSTSVVILLADQADVSAAYNIKDQDERGWYVYNTLTKHAERTQVALKASLQARGISYQSFWAANMIVATADRPLVESLAARADVARIESNKPSRWIEDPAIANVSDATHPSSPDTVETGVTNVNAPAVWAMGFTGQGIVVGGLDTGIRWTHNALKPKYRGWNGVSADHNYNWHDSIHSGGGSCGPDSPFPCDDFFHGSHTVGTMVGDDGTGNQVGVAPGAKWIGCRNMDQGNGTPTTYTECFQFVIAPTDLAGANPNPALRPHVLNNSWGCPPSEGCAAGTLETIVNNTQAAGIFVVASAGNDGPNCSSISNGTNAGPPAIYDASFSVGAISGTTNALQSFSSRGPSLFYTPNLLKPNISAPGANVRSVTNTSDSAYSSASGTSMAGPHVAGVIALLWSARPLLLRNIGATKALLQNTANPAVTLVPTQTCGGTPSTQIPNNSFGYGRVDALAAVNAAPTAAAAKISGQIVTAAGTPVSGAAVTVQSEARTIRAVTNNDGFYKVENLEVGGFFTLTPSRANYEFAPANRSFSLVGDKTDAAFTGLPISSNANPLESPEFFVRQHYLDFLSREPEQAGLDYWSGQLRACGSDLTCLNDRRIGVSAAFFAEREFQDSGLYIYDLYRGALGRRPDYAEYSVDKRNVVGGPQLEADKAAFAAGFVGRTEFTTRYPMTMSADTFVDALLGTAQQSSGLDLSARRDELVALYGTGTTATESRSLVLRNLVESSMFKQSQYNAAFVLTQYFSYLGRNPDPTGYDFWLGVLNDGDRNNYRGMVCSFITSAEYQRRFSPVVTRSNTECGQ